MRDTILFALKGCKKFSCILLLLLVMLLSSMVVAACDGSCNGVGNCSCNGNGSCNGDGGLIPSTRQQAHSTLSGASALAATSSIVKVQPANSISPWILTSDNNYLLGVRIEAASLSK